ncbi:MAG: hypothetical protein AB7V42_15210 [Thermoleophilia bacterium]
MSETQETATAVEESPAAAEVEEPAAVADDADAVAEAPDEATEEPQDEPEAEAEPEPAVEAEPVAAAAPARQANVYLCERGHRTVTLWSQPTNCHAKPTRSGPECGRQLYPVGQLPEQVQKALNPLKASKKASKG